MTFLPELTEEVGVPRALAVRFPYGAPFGDPGNRWLQERIVDEALALFESVRRPRTIVKSRYGWRQVAERSILHPFGKIAPAGDDER